MKMAIAGMDTPCNSAKKPAQKVPVLAATFPKQKNTTHQQKHETLVFLRASFDPTNLAGGRATNIWMKESKYQRFENDLCQRTNPPKWEPHLANGP